MANFWQKLGLVKKDEGPPVVETKVTATQQQVAAPLFTTFGGANVVAPVGSKNDYKALFDEVLAGANQPGFDFFEFSKNIAGLDNKPLGEQQKYEIVFETAKSLNISIADLIASGKYYLNRLDEEDASFMAHIQDTTAKKITARKQDAESLTQRNAQLATEIESNNQKIQEINTSTFNSQNELGVEENAFKFELNNRKGLYNDRLTKIQQYLK